MKKFLKLGAVLIGVTLVLACLAGCESLFGINSGSSSVELSGGINGYYIQTRTDKAYHTKGYLKNDYSDYWWYVEEKDEDCAVKFNISKNNFELASCSNNKTLRAGSLGIYSKDNSGNFFRVGRVYITPVDKNYDLKFEPKGSE